MMALTICSMICEMALGIIVPSPWKNPRKTPRTATTISAGPKILSANTLYGVFKSVPVKNSAPKNTTSDATIPDTRAKRSAPFNT